MDILSASVTKRKPASRSKVGRAKRICIAT